MRWGSKICLFEPNGELQILEPPFLAEFYSFRYSHRWNLNRNEFLTFIPVRVAGLMN